MGEKRFDQLATTLTTLADDDVIAVQDVSDNETAQITVVHARGALSATLQQVYDRGGPEIEPPDVYTPVITVAGEVGGVPYEGASLWAGGLASRSPLEVTPWDAGSGEDGLHTTIKGGDSPSGSWGGNLTLNAGQAAAGDDGEVRIATGGGRQISSGSGSTPWAHDGDLSVTGDLSVNGLVVTLPQAPTEVSDASLALNDTMHGRTLLCTHVSGCTITVPDTVSPGLTVAIRQRGAGQVTIQGSGTMVVTPAPTFAVAANTARTAELGCLAVVSVDSATVCSVDGDLEAA